MSTGRRRTQKGILIAAIGVSALFVSRWRGPVPGVAASPVSPAIVASRIPDEPPSGGAERPLPRGVPFPEFGLRERAEDCADCTRVSQEHLSGLDDLSPGTVVELSGGPFEATDLEIGGPGTAERPIFIRGADPGAPTVIRGNALIRGAHLVVENLDFDLSSSSSGVYVEGHHIALRSSTVRGYRPGRFSTALVLVNSRDIVLTGLHVFDNGDPEVVGEHDVHGIAAASSERFWVLNSSLHANRGDGIQLGHRARNTVREVYIAGNDIHGNGENAVDIKEASDVLITGNRLHGAPPEHPAVVLHDCPVNAAVIFNEIYDAPAGVSLASLQSSCAPHRPVSLFVLRNLFREIARYAVVGWGSGKRYAIAGNCFDGVGAAMKLSNVGSDSIVEEGDSSLEKGLERLRETRGIELSPTEWRQAECGIGPEDLESDAGSRPERSPLASE